MTYANWRDRFAEAIDETLYPLEWLDKRVAHGSARFWGNERAAILAEIKVYPTGAKEVHGLVAAITDDATLGDIIALIPLAERWGEAKGCTRASVSSHPAWARLLAPLGYQVEQVTVAKGL